MTSCCEGVVGVLVDAHDDGGVDVGAGRGDDHLAGARPQVCRRGGARAEQAGRLHDDVDAEVLPWKIFRIGLLQDADLVTVDVEPTTGDLDGAGPRAVRRVVAQEVGERLRWRQVVDGDDLDRRLGGTACPVRRDPHQIPPDSAHPVDAHSYAHVLALPRLSLLTSWMRLRCSRPRSIGLSGGPEDLA